jgi:hypothetical protein
MAKLDDDATDGVRGANREPSLHLASSALDRSRVGFLQTPELVLPLAVDVRSLAIVS